MCVHFTVRRREDLEEDSSETFHPEFAHQIFGENESIFGYKDLRIRLYYSAGPLNIYLGLKYAAKVDDGNQNGLKADDVVANVSKLLTTGCYYTNIDEFASKLEKEESFRPFGTKVHSWTIDSSDNATRTFEIYECTAKTSGFVAFHARLQSFLLWFVDAASYIDIEDPQWQFFVWWVTAESGSVVCHANHHPIPLYSIYSYEKYTNANGKVVYATTGYTTVYLYYAYPQHNRPRISQMFILPPFQGIGIGATLIEVVYNKFKGDPRVVDITVEDPSDDFRRVRNYVDAKLCRALPEFSAANLKKGFSKEMSTAAKEQLKVSTVLPLQSNDCFHNNQNRLFSLIAQINPRQCRIVYEILRLDVTNVGNEAEYKEYRLTVKKRLNTPYYKQQAELARMQKAGVDMQIAMASIPTKNERIEQLKDEYTVRVHCQCWLVTRERWFMFLI